MDHGEPLSERPPHPSGDLFNSYLRDYQEDINRIIGKYRYSNHHLELEEIASRANLSLLKNRDNILYKYEGEFNKDAFSKVAYTYVRNIIGWSHSKEAKDKYVKNRLDSTHSTEEGLKTSFELAIATEGYEESGFEAFDSNEKFTTLLHVIKEYCHILTDGELKILSCLESGMTHEQISNRFKFTRQAVSICAIKLFNKIKAHFSSDALNDDVSHKVSAGIEAVNDFFTSSNGYVRLSDKDKKSLRKFLLANINLHNCKSAAKAFMNGKYSYLQISSFCVKNKLNFCLLKTSRCYKFNKDEEILIASLYNQGRTAKEIASKLKVDPKVVSGKKGHLYRLGLLKRG
jgi:transcriptional regulator